MNRRKRVTQIMEITRDIVIIQYHYQVVERVETFPDHVGKIVPSGNGCCLNSNSDLSKFAVLAISIFCPAAWNLGQCQYLKDKEISDINYRHDLIFSNLTVFDKTIFIYFFFLLQTTALIGRIEMTCCDVSRLQHAFV